MSRWLQLAASPISWATPFCPQTPCVMCPDGCSWEAPQCCREADWAWSQHRRQGGAEVRCHTAARVLKYTSSARLWVHLQCKKHNCNAKIWVLLRTRFNDCTKKKRWDAERKQCFICLAYFQYCCTLHTHVLSCSKEQFPRHFVFKVNHWSCSSFWHSLFEYCCGIFVCCAPLPPSTAATHPLFWHSLFEQCCGIINMLHSIVFVHCSNTPVILAQSVNIAAV